LSARSVDKTIKNNPSAFDCITDINKNEQKKGAEAPFLSL